MPQEILPVTERITAKPLDPQGDDMTLSANRPLSASFGSADQAAGRSPDHVEGDTLLHVDQVICDKVVTLLSRFRSILRGL